MEEIGRKHPAHSPAVERHNAPIIIFLTSCTKDRKPILANAAAHELLQASWRKARLWSVGRYIVMPDHVHLFCAGKVPAEAANGMGGVLEIGFRAVLAQPKARAGMATPFLGHAIAARRKLR